MLSVDVSLILLLGSNKVYNILFKNLNISFYYFEFIEKIWNLILSKKLVLLENKFNDNFFASEKNLAKKMENLANGNAAKHRETDVDTKRTF